ncbi:hypothetical protein [Pelagibius sp. Alg239-R121]|uniref:hypothetical protein n=1 Tax=Pelagibius sp. Alg239-R121 TaxID=2993448 RepID=UPI0024A6FEEE|nr:hypothetical protein [Pelagibius sp. Alg239-R121]
MPSENGKFVAENFKLVASHRTQVPNGAVTLEVKTTEDVNFVVAWSADPDRGGFDPDSKAGLKTVWTSPPEMAASYIIRATITQGSADPGTPPKPSSTRGQKRSRAATPPSPDTAGDPIVLSHSIEVTPAALPNEVLEKIDAGVAALKQGLPGDAIRLQRQHPPLGPQKALWAIIRNRAEAIGFNNYKKFVDAVMCDGKVPETSSDPARDLGELRYRGTDAYEILKKATEAFLMHETGIAHQDIAFDGKEERRRLPQLAGSSDEEAKADLESNRDAYLTSLDDETRTFPYFAVIRDRLSEIPLKPPGAPTEGCYGILKSRIAPPVLLELIWSYWNEEGMLVQTLKAISMRFQNRTLKRTAAGGNPLASMNLDPLRPLSNIIWGYVQDEHNRLTLARRAYEYDHHYGFTIVGKAVPKIEPADSRIGFLPSFHSLLHRVSIFFKEQADTTKVPDGYPLLNALKECHLLLAQGAHNQYGELPWTARQEMLIEQWLLARPETRDFLSRRAMVPYPEEWMPAVEQMRDLMGWRGASIRHFQDLAVYGEMILLSIRFGNWSDEIDENVAMVWAQYWRQELQAYNNAYRAVTGVDLSADGDQANQSLLERRRTSPAALLNAQAKIAAPAK